MYYLWGKSYKIDILWLFRRIKLTILAIFLKSDIKWRHFWRHCNEIIDFCYLKMILLCSSLILLSDRYNITLHHIVYRKLLYEIYGLYLKNAKNCQKWRLYDVIMTSRSYFENLFFTFLNFSHDLHPDRLGYFLSYHVFWVQNGKKCVFWRFPHISLIKPL